MKNVKESANFIWSIADLLRGDYKQSDYGKVILPLTVLRRLDCVLSSTKANVLKKYEQIKTTDIKNIDPVLNKVAGYSFHNRSPFDFDKLIADPNNIASNLRNYINGFSEDAREVIEQFEFENHINKMDDANLLYLVVKRSKSDEDSAYQAWKWVTCLKSLFENSLRFQMKQLGNTLHHVK